MSPHLSRAWPLVLAGLALAGPALGQEAQPLPTAVTLAEAPTPEAEAPYPLHLRGLGRISAVRNSAYGVDPSGARSSDDLQAASRITLFLDLDTGKRWGDWALQGSVGTDLVSGTFAGAPTLAGDKIPGKRFDDALLTQAWLGVSLRDLVTLKAGVMQSVWGLGLIANDGNHALDDRRDAWFVLPNPGDRVARAQVVLQPWGRSQSAARGLILAFSLDEVIEDANAVYSAGDRAMQEVAAVRWYLAPKRWLGMYYVHRDQTYKSADGPFLKVNVIDAAFDMDYRKEGSGLRVQGEAAAIVGRTSLSPTPDYPEHDVRQGAVLLKGRYDVAPQRLRFELEGAWFSGDANLDDDAVTAFKANPGFRQGILLFPQVLGWQSGRARITASNKELTGYPAQDLDRLATGGQMTSAWTVYPKAGWKPLPFLEVYGAVLLAFSPTPPIDPFSTRVNGGTPRNFLGNAPSGSLLGTEFDLGAVVTVTPSSWPLTAAVRAEYGLLVPGGVETGLDSPIHGGRLSLYLTRTPKTEAK